MVVLVVVAASHVGLMAFLVLVPGMGSVSTKGVVVQGPPGPVSAKSGVPGKHEFGWWQQSSVLVTGPLVLTAMVLPAV